MAVSPTQDIKKSSCPPQGMLASADTQLSSKAIILTARLTTLTTFCPISTYNIMKSFTSLPVTLFTMGLFGSGVLSLPPNPQAEPGPVDCKPADAIKACKLQPNIGTLDNVLKPCYPKNPQDFDSCNCGVSSSHPPSLPSLYLLLQSTYLLVVDEMY